jgi:hypothetical protein
MSISTKSPNKQLNNENISTDGASLNTQKASIIDELGTPVKTFINSIENKNKTNQEEDVSNIEPVAFTINKIINQNDIPAALFLDCEIEIGGTRYPRIVAINPHSIFVLERHTSDVSKRSVRSQRALLEIARVSYTIGKAVKVVYKASQGGDHVTFYMTNPIDCVKAISRHLKRLGVQGNEAKKQQNHGNSNRSNSNRKKTPQRGISPFFGSSLSRSSNNNISKSNSNNATPRFGGGGRNESPYASIKRLEKEMRARPTINVVRGIMDRYRRLIERCSADSRPRVQKQAEMLTRDLQLFLQRPEVLQTLSDQEQIEKQRHRRRDSLTLYDLDVENDARLASSKGNSSYKRGNDEALVVDANKNGDLVTARQDDNIGVEINGADVVVQDSAKNDNTNVNGSVEGKKQKSFTATTESALQNLTDNKSGASTLSQINDIVSSDQPIPGWRGTPYHRKPGEVYKTPDTSKSQINHARVAESGTLLPGRVLVEVTVKPPPIARRSLFNNMFASPPLNTNNNNNNDNQIQNSETNNSSESTATSKVTGDKAKVISSPSSTENNDKTSTKNHNRRPSVELLASMMGETYEDVLQVVGNKEDKRSDQEKQDEEENLQQQR